MIEVPLSMVAWFSVVAVQALVHFVVLGSRRQRQQQQRQHKLDVPRMLIDDEAESIRLRSCSSGSTDSMASYHNVSSCPDLSNVDEADATAKEIGEDIVDELDGDEPQNFLELLDQTGEEIVQNLSVESIAKEQIVSTQQ